QFLETRGPVLEIKPALFQIGTVTLEAAVGENGPNVAVVTNFRRGRAHRFRRGGESENGRQRRGRNQGGKENGAARASRHDVVFSRRRVGCWDKSALVGHKANYTPSGAVLPQPPSSSACATHTGLALGHRIPPLSDRPGRPPAHP